MADLFKRNIKGFRGGRRPCPCCVETSSKPGRSRLARHRIKAADKALFREALEEVSQEAGCTWWSCPCVTCQWGRRCGWCREPDTPENPVEGGCHVGCMHLYDFYPPGAWP